MSANKDAAAGDVLPARDFAAAADLIGWTIPTDLAPEAIGIIEPRAQQRSHVGDLAIACSRLVDALAQGPEVFRRRGLQREVIDPPALEYRQVPLRDLDPGDLERVKQEAATKVDVTRALRLLGRGQRSTSCASSRLTR